MTPSDVECRVLAENSDLDSDFSTNAWIPGTEEVTRHYERSDFRDWCYSNKVKYSEGFRDLILQINPHYIPCVYKKMFETCVTGNLRLAEGDARQQKENKAAKYPVSRSSRAGCYSAPATPLLGQHGDIANTGAPCVFQGISGAIRPKSAGKDLCGWELCKRSHSVTGTGYQLLSADEDTAVNRRQVKTTCYRVLSPKTFTRSLRNNRHSHGSNCRYESANAQAPSKPRQVSRDHSEGPTVSNCRSSSSTTTASSGIEPPRTGSREFKHHKKSTSYIEQYREVFTYPRIKGRIDDNSPTPVDVFICTFGSHACPRSVTSSSGIQRWYSNQSHSRDHVATCEKSPCITSGVPAPQKTRIQKKRLLKKPPKQTQKVDELQKIKGTSTQINQTNQQMGFLANSITVTNFNPKRPTISVSRSHVSRVTTSSSTSLMGEASIHGNSENGSGTALETRDSRVCLAEESVELPARMCSLKGPSISCSAHQ